MFTGKNKEQFEKWFREKKPKNYSINYITMCSDKAFLFMTDNVIKAFECSPFSMQQGVYLEYLDSVSYHIKPWHDWEYDYYSFNIVNLYGVTLKCISGYKSRQEALTEAFKKADELINNK